MFSSILTFSLLSLSLPYTALASSQHGSAHRRHDAIAHAIHNTTEAVEENVPSLQRRGAYTNARLTYYDVGLGACGKTNVPSDYIVALNSIMYGGGYPGPNCFRPIQISYNGKTVDATIMDECPGCPNHGLDLSEGLFKALAPLDVGVLYAEWWFTDGGDGGDGGSTPTTTQTPTSTHHTTSTSIWTPPTSTWEPPSISIEWTTHSTSHWTPLVESTSTSTSSTHTTSSKPKTTSHSSTSTWSSTWSSSSSSSWTPSSSSVAPTATAVGSIEKLNQAFVGMADLLLGAAQAAA